MCAVLLLTSGCSDYRAKQEAMANVRHYLKDPASATFDDPISVAGEGAARIACGLVNAKNSLGGYVGAKPFMVWNDEVFMGMNDDEAAIVSKCCSALYLATLKGERSVIGTCDRLPPGSPAF